MVVQSTGRSVKPHASAGSQC